MCQLLQFLKNIEKPPSPRRRRATACASEVPEHQETSREKYSIQCPRDLIITDWHGIENNVASEVHVKRFKSKE